MFDEQPDGDPHGECAAEIHRLQAELAAEREKVRVLRGALQQMLVVYQGKKQGIWGESTKPVIDARAALTKTGEKC